MQLSHNATLLALGPAAAPAVTSQLWAWPAMRPGGSEAAGFSASRLAAPPEFNNAKQAGLREFPCVFVLRVPAARPKISRQSNRLLLLWLFTPSLMFLF